MTRKFRIALIALFAGSAVLPVGVSAGDEPEKAQLCASCHGPGGTKPIMDTYPIIGGQYPDYLRKTLLEYKNGERKNVVMNGQAAALSKEEIKELSRYYGKQESPLYTPSIPKHKVD